MEQKPVILFLTSRYPYPLDKGDKVRVYHQLKVLNNHFRVILICVNEGLPPSSDLKNLEPVCFKQFVFDLPIARRRRYLPGHFLKGLPLQVAYFFDPYIKSRISELIEELQPSHVHVHLLRMALYVDGLSHPSKSLDLMDSLVLNDLAGQYLNSFPSSVLKNVERKRIKKFEDSQIRKFQKVFIISERDRGYLEYSIQEDVDVLQNGVEIIDVSTDVDFKKRSDILFCGNLSYSPNQKAVEFIKNKIAPVLPNRNFQIVGADIPEVMKRNLPSNVKVVGWVEDIRKMYRQSEALIAPIYSGSGQQNKVLEALAEETPVITTSFVNESIGATKGEHLLIASDEVEFVEHIKLVLSRPEIAAELSEKGRMFVERKFSWKVNTAPLVSYIKRVVSTDE